MSAEYELALTAVREATDAEYLAARKVYEEADRLYEIAFAKEQGKGN